ERVALQAIAWMLMQFVVAVASQLLGPSLQLFLMDASPDAPSLAAALHHSALNIGNSLGAALGAAVLAAGFGLLAPAWTGVVLALLGLGIASCSYLTHRRQQARAEVAAQAAAEGPVACCARVAHQGTTSHRGTVPHQGTAPHRGAVPHQLTPPRSASRTGLWTPTRSVPFAIQRHLSDRAD